MTAAASLIQVDAIQFTPHCRPSRLPSGGRASICDSEAAGREKAQPRLKEAEWPFTCSASESPIAGGCALPVGRSGSAPFTGTAMPACPTRSTGDFVLATLLAITDLRLGEGTDAAEVCRLASLKCWSTTLTSSCVKAGWETRLGKTVRNLVTGLSGRISQWRTALKSDWTAAIRSSLYRDQNPDDPGGDRQATESAIGRIVVPDRGRSFGEGVAA